MATFINLILKTEKKSNDSSSRQRKAAIGSRLALMASRQRRTIF
jgi:hypothetical protein